MTATIRDATPADTATLLGFIRALAEFEKLSHEVVTDEAALKKHLFGEKPKAFALIAEMGGKAVGFAIAFYNFSTFVGKPGIYIEDVFVAPEARGHGIGTAFFRYVAAKAKAEGCGRVEWVVLDWNQPAVDFYHNLGAQSLEDWVINRLSGPALDALAAKKEAA